MICICLARATVNTPFKSPHGPCKHSVCCGSARESKPVPTVWTEFPQTHGCANGKPADQATCPSPTERFSSKVLGLTAKRGDEVMQVMAVENLHTLSVAG